MWKRLRNIMRKENVQENVQEKVQENVNEDVNEAGRFDVYEEFVSEQAFEFHQNRVKDSDWGVVSKNVTRFYVVDGL